MLLALCALALFLFTGSSQVDPNISAPWLVQLLHIAPFPSLEYPIWGWIARFLARLNVAHFARILNVFSALCGAGSVALLYLLLRAGTYRPKSYLSRSWISVLAALAGAAFLMISTPFWMVSNRAHPASFDLLLLLGSLFLLQRYRRTTRPFWLYAFAVVYGIGLAELATFALFLPLIGFYVLYLTFRIGHLKWRIWLPMTLLGLLGASLYLLAVLEYYHLPVAEWREAHSFWEMLKFFLLDRKRLILSSVPRHGWLLLFIGTVVPWVVIWFAHRREEANPKLLIFYAILFGISLAILFDTMISPWRVLGTNPLLITPYLLIAYTYGALIERFGILDAVLIQSKSRRKKRSFAPILPVVALLPLAVAGVRNAPLVSTKSARVADALTRATFDLAAGRTLWAGDGLMENLLQLDAYRRGATFNYVNLLQSDTFTYRSYISSLFDDPRFKSLALAGSAPLLSAWLEQDENAVGELAITMRPDIWLIAGLEPIPMGITYLGAAERSDLDPMQTWQRNVDYWSVVEAALPLFPTNFVETRILGLALRQQVSHVANDLGVFMERAGYPAEATRAYEQAMVFEPENLSAALNLLALAENGNASIDTTAAEALLAREREAANPRRPMQVAARFGHLRSRAAAELLLPASRKPDAPLARDPALTPIMQLFQEGESDEARRRLERFLVAQPASPEGWTLLALAGFREGRADDLERSYKQMKILGQEWPVMIELLARLRQQQGNLAEARDLYSRALARRPGDFALMQRLLDLEVAAGDWNSVERLLNQLLSMAPANDDANYYLAILLQAKGRLDMADTVLKQQLARGRAPRLLVELSSVQRQRGDLTGAIETAAEAILRMPQSARAHEALGRAYLESGDLERAGEEIKIARETNPDLISAVFAQMDWYTRKGDATAAVALARETLASGKLISAADEAALRKVTR